MRPAWAWLVRSTTNRSVSSCSSAPYFSRSSVDNDFCRANSSSRPTPAVLLNLRQFQSRLARASRALTSIANGKDTCCGAATTRFNRHPAARCSEGGGPCSPSPPPAAAPAAPPPRVAVVLLLLLP